LQEPSEALAIKTAHLPPESSPAITVIAITAGHMRAECSASSNTPLHFTREQAYEGKYVIQTEEPNLSAVEAVRLYKELIAFCGSHEKFGKCLAQRVCHDDSIKLAQIARHASTCLPTSP
jgi:hypothetical protein